MKKILVIQNHTTATYGSDLEGNLWCSFLSGTPVACARCGTKIINGYECGMPGSTWKQYCASHVQWVYREEDHTGVQVELKPL